MFNSGLQQRKTFTYDPGEGIVALQSIYIWTSYLMFEFMFKMLFRVNIVKS